MIAPMEQHAQRYAQAAHAQAARQEDPAVIRRHRQREDSASLVQRIIGEHPVAAVAAAATLGLVLGWIVKRR
ncbi:hypothetical protein [Roseimaritima sediminicola]|uniref:hypothetical protein n=1 Tax=Roseimaritima sediminicola TaxID=2662066 RepID=UPI001298492C|nr:hypothetical protein [Roseimaritima sediminicola]